MKKALKAYQSHIEANRKHLVFIILLIIVLISMAIKVFGFVIKQ